jgi:hypothetical protein
MFTQSLPSNDRRLSATTDSTFDTTRTAQKMMRPNVPLLLPLYPNDLLQNFMAQPNKRRLPSVRHLPINKPARFLVKLFCAIDKYWLLFNLVVCEVNITDLDSFSFIRHFLVQIATLLTADRSFLVEISTVSPIAMTAVSSANVAMVLFDVVGTSLI